MPESVDVQVAKLEVEAKEIFKRLDKIEDTQTQIYRLATSVEKLAVNMNHIDEKLTSTNSKIDNLDTRIQTIESEPKRKLNKMWEWVIGGAIAAIVAAAMHLILNM